MSLALGIPVRELQARVSSQEFGEWLAFERIYGPIDVGRRIDLAAALVASVLANIYRDPKKRRKPYEVADFLPQYDDDVVQQRRGRGRSPEEMLAMVEMLNAAFGGRDLRSKGPEWQH